MSYLIENDGAGGGAHEPVGKEAGPVAWPSWARPAAGTCCVRLASCAPLGGPSHQCPAVVRGFFLQSQVLVPVRVFCSMPRLLKKSCAPPWRDLHVRRKCLQNRQRTDSLWGVWGPRP